jgi:hypothetical protein
MQDFISKIWSFVKLAYGTVQPKVVAVPMQAWLVIGFGAACFLGGCVCAKADEPALACPVAGSQCKCGCLSGQQCSCASKAAPPKPAGKLQPSNPDPVQASVRVDVPYTDGTTHHGSGTVVALYRDNDGKPSCVILTNRHVCPVGGCKIKVIWPGNRFSSDANWLGCDDREDIAAICAFAPSDATECRPAVKPPAIGDELIQVGYPKAQWPIRRVGAALGGYPTFSARITTENGDSGSGLFDRSGRLVAVNHGTQPDDRQLLCGQPDGSASLLAAIGNTQAVSRTQRRHCAAASAGAAFHGLRAADQRLPLLSVTGWPAVAGMECLMQRLQDKAAALLIGVAGVMLLLLGVWLGWLRATGVPLDLGGMWLVVFNAMPPWW